MTLKSLLKWIVGRRGIHETTTQLYKCVLTEEGPTLYGLKHASKV
jgi:hypothetical protein